MRSLLRVEEHFLGRQTLRPAYPERTVNIIEVENIYELGQLTALSFLEYIRTHPRAVIALPTGKTPEYFIKTLEKYRDEWHSEKIQKELVDVGYLTANMVGQSAFPATNELTFVMLDEFFPISTQHRNSFVQYVRTFYMKILQLSPHQVLDFDLVSQGIVTAEDMALFPNGAVNLALLQAEEAQLSDVEVKQRQVLVKVQTFCEEYEAKIRALGGIDFFLGGIGPDGHIAFNQMGADHECTTRLVSFNYPTAAAAAGDLGGIERARQTAAMTIGLKTITYKPTAHIIIMAAGEGKADVVREAIEEEISTERPASILQKHDGARFYITHGAAKKLNERQKALLMQVREDIMQWAEAYLSGYASNDGNSSASTISPYLLQPPRDYALIEAAIYEASLHQKTPLHELTLPSMQGQLPSWLQNDQQKFLLLRACARKRLIDKIMGGLNESMLRDMRIVHTAPHHDDIMLSYHAAMHEMLGRSPSIPYSRPSLAICAENSQAFGGNNNMPVYQRQGRLRSSSGTTLAEGNLGEYFNNNANYFAYLTSGFHSVNDDFLLRKVEMVFSPHSNDNRANAPQSTTTFLEYCVVTGQLTRDYDDLLIEFREAFESKDFGKQEVIEAIIFLRKVAEVWNIVITESYPQLVLDLTQKIKDLKAEYLDVHQPGDAVPKQIQLLKGCMRESEVDRVWALSRMPVHRIHHMRSKFYTDDFFTPMPSLEGDALPMANLIKAKQPDVLTVAFDPEGTGPDTHYKVLLVVAAGLRIALERRDLAHAKNMLVWGYRNVWFRFLPHEATLMIPCSEADLQLMDDTFMSCFTTQKFASFPSPYYDGPFSAWAKDIQIRQKVMLECLLGADYFTQHPYKKVKDCTGFIFIRAMPIDIFLNEVEELKSKFELKH